MKHSLLLAVISCILCIQAAPIENVKAAIEEANPLYVLSSSAHHIPDDDPLVSIFVDILHDGDGETDPEPYEENAAAEAEAVQSPKEQMKKRVLAVADDETTEDVEDGEVDEERDNRIGKFVNIHVGIDNRGNGNGDGLVNLPM